MGYEEQYSLHTIEKRHLLLLLLVVVVVYKEEIPEVLELLLTLIFNTNFDILVVSLSLFNSHINFTDTTD